LSLQDTGKGAEAGAELDRERRRRRLVATASYELIMGRRADHHQFVVLASSLCCRVAVAAAALPLLLLIVNNGVAAAEGVCGKVRCGMGTCAESSDYAFGFACQCKTGWSRYHLGSLQFPFLPCVIPNCKITSA
jgi:hypothetical protein